MSKKTTYTEADIGYIQMLMQDTVSLSTPVGNEEDGDGESELEDFIPDEVTNLMKEAEDEDTKRTLNKYLDKWLKPREIIVIKLRYGLVDGIPRSLAEIGREFNLTRERIRQIEEKALDRLRKRFEVKNIKKEDI